MRTFDLAGAHGAWQMMAATMHRPNDAAGLAAAARELASQGLKAHDIAASLRIGVAAVEQALREGCQQ
jgi:hypothetical protein